jgi:DNA invertase Pin-like site-specific DNA recombinase
MKVKYNRVSTLKQTGNRFSTDKTKYDITILEKVSGTIPFRERPKVKSELIPLIEKRKLKELYVEDVSKCGRNTGDVISSLEWLDSHNINVIVLNLGLQSRPNNRKNPVWKLITSILSSIYELERENIIERTNAGRIAYVQNGGVLGRPEGTAESDKDFLKKKKSQEVMKQLKRGLSIRHVGGITKCSPMTVQKVKQISKKYLL